MHTAIKDTPATAKVKGGHLGMSWINELLNAFIMFMFTKYYCMKFNDDDGHELEILYARLISNYNIITKTKTLYNKLNHLVYKKMTLISTCIINS